MVRIRSMGWMLLVGIAVLGVTVAWPPGMAPAEESIAEADDDTTRYAGTYKYGKSLDHGRRIVRKAMEKVIDELPFVYRGLARRRLAESDPLVHRIIIGLPGDSISMTFIGEKRGSFTTKRGVKQKVTNLQGKQVDLTQRFVKAGLEQIWVGPNGTSRALYALQADNKRLVVVTTMKGERISTPIRYRLEYVKQ